MPTPICLSLWDTTNETHQGAFIALLIWATKFSGFHNTKTSANKRLLLCLLPFAADVQTSPAQVHGAKVLQNLRMCKKNRILVRFFWCGVYGVECKGRNLLGGKSPSTKQTSGKCPNTIGGEITIIGNLFRKLVNFLRK